MDWEEIYSGTADFFGSEPDRLVRDYISDICKLRILDIGAGQGRNCIPLARRGHAVTAIDISDVGMGQVRAAALHEGLDIRTWVGDFRGFSPKAGLFDVVLVLGLIPAIGRDGLKALQTKLGKWTAAGGRVLLTAFTVEDPSYARCESEWRKVGRNSYANEAGEVRTFMEEGEVLELFAGYDIIHHWEGAGAEHHHGDGPVHHHGIVELVARKRVV